MSEKRRLYMRAKKFDASSQSWRRVIEKPANVQVETLTTLTYNVWFAERERVRRTVALIECIKTVQADIICLQEVTGPVAAQIGRHPFIRENFYCNDPEGKAMLLYGLLFLTKFPVLNR